MATVMGAMAEAGYRDDGSRRCDWLKDLMKIGGVMGLVGGIGGMVAVPGRCQWRSRCNPEGWKLLVEVFRDRSHRTQQRRRDGWR